MTIPESEYIYDFSFPKEEGKPNPHLWTNPPMAKRYGEIIADELAKVDPANADYYQGNYEKFAAKLDELDQAMRTSFATIPREAQSCSPTTTPTPTSARSTAGTSSAPSR